MSVKLNNPLFEKLGMKYPIIQGGMAWAGTGHLAGAVSEAGGLGIIGTGYWKADKVREEIRRAREVTDKPFGVNVMLLSRHIREVFDVIIEEGVKVVATGAGDPSPTPFTPPVFQPISLTALHVSSRSTATSLTTASRFFSLTSSMSEASGRSSIS